MVDYLEPYTGDPWDQAFAWRDPPRPPPAPPPLPSMLPGEPTESPARIPGAYVPRTEALSGGPAVPVIGADAANAYPARNQAPPQTLGGALREGAAEGWGSEPVSWNPLEFAGRTMGAATSAGTSALSHGLQEYAGVDRTTAEQVRRDLNLAATDMPTSGLLGETLHGAAAGARAAAPLAGAVAADESGALRIGSFDRQAALEARREEARARYRDPNAPPALAESPPTFVEPKQAAGADYVTVYADPAKVRASTAKGSDYVGPGGEGGIAGRYERFGEFTKTGEPIEMPQMGIGHTGEAEFGNGRHRFSYLADQGLTSIPVRVPAEQAAAFAERFGITPEAPPPPMGHNRPPPDRPRQAAVPAPAPAEVPPEAPGPLAAALEPPREVPPAPTPAEVPPTPAPPEAAPGPLAAALEPPRPPEAPPTPPPQEVSPTPPPEAAPAEVPLLHRENPFSEHLDDMHPDEHALTVNQILSPDTPALKARSRGVRDIAGELQDRARAALTALGVPGGQITEGGNPNHDELISRIMASEAREALNRSGMNAADWYTGRVRDAVTTASMIYPEIGTDPNAAAAFRAIKAVTSQGEVVPSNVRLTDQIYQYYRQHGRFPTDLNDPNGLSGINAKEAPAMNGNFEKLNDLLEHGAATGDPGYMREFLDRDFRYGDLVAMTPGMGKSELMDTQVKGSAILGSKIGGGFYQNLGGNYDPVTMDLWFMRNWGRLTGGLVGKADTSAQMARLDAAIAAADRRRAPPGLSPEDRATFRLDRDRLEQARAETGIGVPQNDAERLVLARNLFKQHERDFDVNRTLYDNGSRIKSELTNSSQRFIEGLQGVNQAPTSGSQRNWMRARVNRAREILQQHGHDVTNADLQAILWYPEKELYSKLGGRESAGLNVDYASAWRDMAKSKGYTDAQIDAAIRASYGRPGPAHAAADAGGAPALQAGGRGAHGQGEGGGGGQEGQGASLEPVNGDPFAFQ